MIDEHRVQCNICGENFRATPSHINRICKGCFKNNEKELIEEFLEDLKRYPHNNKLLISDLIKKWEKRRD